MGELRDRYVDELALLRDLFGDPVVETAFERLELTFDYTEARWLEYVQRLDGEIKYVLIAEAPPWVAEGRPQYLLDPASRSRTLMRALSRTFPQSHASPIETLAAHGFLLFDSIPFAMDYSSKRSSPKYEVLVRASLQSFLTPKLETGGLAWASDVRMAFAVARNARAIMRTTSSLPLGAATAILSADLIAVNAAGYPDAAKLRSLFGLMPDRVVNASGEPGRREA